MDVLEGLNDEQRRAAEHDTGPMLVVAGAGTGKTQVITRRIAHLIQTGKAKPPEVLALTFTERAAREMEERLYDLIGWESFQVPVLTFNAFGGELLGRYANQIGRSIRGGLLNDTQKVLLLMQHIDEIELEYYRPAGALYEFLEGIVDYVGRLQNAGISTADYAQYVSTIPQHSPGMHTSDVAEQRDLQRLYELYEGVKYATGTYDFYDQLNLPLQILQRYPNLVERLRSEYHYVLVDEYQDTNPVQDRLLRELVGREGNIFAVGDDDQAIYGFRGADINNILSFADHFALAEPVALVQNYRSGQPILDAAYRLIQHNDPDRLEVKLGINKRLKGLNDDGLATFVAYESPSDEQQGIVKQVAERLAAGQSADQLAVLSATHAPLKALAKQLRAQGVGYSLSTSVNIFEQPELLTLWYLLQWIAGVADEAAVSHVLLGPYLHWSQPDYQTLKSVADDQLTSLEAALQQSSDEPAVGLARRLAEWRELAVTEPVSRLLFRLVFETEVVERWRSQALQTARLVRVFEDLTRWLDQMQDFETISADPSLARYLSFFPKPPQLEVTEPVGDPTGVALLTVHAAKGLEYDTVFLMGCTQRNWSRGSSLGRTVPEQLIASVETRPEHEYRRLFYVALTRAKQSIVVSSSTKTQTASRQLLTPFIYETFGEQAAESISNLEKAATSEKVMSKVQQYYPLRQTAEGLTLPFERAEGWIELGVTALARYNYCPFEFYLEHGLKLAQPVGPQLSFGTALHRVFELYYRSKLARQEPEASQLHSLLDEHWSNRGYENARLAERDRSQAHQALDRFLQREAVAQRLAVGVEVPIRLELPELKLRLKGKIDAIFELSGGGIQLRDYKTGRSQTDAEKLSKKAKDDFQLRTYALAYDRLGGTPVEEVVLDYIVTDTEGIASLTPTIMRNHADKIASLVERLRARDFAPSSQATHQCSAITYYGTGEQDELAIEALRNAEVELS